MRRKIGFLTIGQSPREDVLGEILPVLGSGVEVKEAGALDSLSMPEILALRPAGNAFPLVTRLRDGTAVAVSREKIVPLLQAKTEELERAGIDILALLCTEDFGELVSRKPLLMPARIMKEFVFAVLDRGRLSVLVPLAGQKKAAEEKWRRKGISVAVHALNPYARNRSLETVGRRIKATASRLVVLDCIGYPVAAKDILREKTNRPVLLPRLVLAAAIRELG